MDAVIVATAEALEKLLAPRYMATSELALVLWLAMQLGRPVLLEGPPGVGKTDMACALAERLERPLFRLQCYEGLDESRALFEWDYAKQILMTQVARTATPVQQTPTEGNPGFDHAIAAALGTKDVLYSEDFLVERPLLAALRSTRPAVLLIDEVDRADAEFEAFLLEYLAEGQVTIPELGTVRARFPVLTLLTSNASRDLSDALRRRCLYVFLQYPPPSAELRILELRVPGIAHSLADQLVRFLSDLRTLGLRKPPSVAEAIDWARSLLLLGKSSLTREVAESTLALLVKYEEDHAQVITALPRLLP
jgi:MoxR-like ATPase